MLDIITSPIFLILLIGASSITFLFLGIMLGQPRKNQVLQVDPISHVGWLLNVEQNNPYSLNCNAISDRPPTKFYKYRAGFLVEMKSLIRTVRKAIWLGSEGRAFTRRVGLNGGSEVKMRFNEALKMLWGEEDYNKIPQKLKTPIEKEDVILGVTVELKEEPITDLESKLQLTESAIQQQQDEDAAQTFWSGYKKTMKGQLLYYFFAAGTGAAIITVIYLFFGIIKVWQPPVTTTTVTK